MSGLCGSFAQVWTQWSYSGAERKTTYPLERWSYSKQTPERIIRGENVIQPSEPIIGFTFQVWAKKKKTSHDHVCFVLWDARSCYVCTRFCTCQSTSVLQRSKTKHHIFFILLLLFYCSSPTEEANEQTKHSHIVCSDTFWLDVHHSHRSPKTLELTPLNLRSVHSWISFLKVKTNVFKPCFKETFCFSIIFIVKLFIN